MKVTGNPNPNPRSGLPMAEMEMNAALALTEMAKIETESERKSTKRIKNVSPDLDVVNSKHACSVEEDSRDNKGSAAVEEERVKVEQNTELSTPNICYPSIKTSSFGHRTKQNMTEAEKEAKRIRRVLANRQSARQTIQRRQALRQDLSRKVADLSLDNENMKMEKELLTKECVSLKNRNKQLKEQVRTLQMAKTIKCEVVGLETPTSPSTELSLVPPNKPSSTQYVQSLWPIASPETIGRYEGGNACRDGGMTDPYVPPQPWFCPLLHRMSLNDLPASHPNRDVDVNSIREGCIPGESIEETTSASINLEEKPIVRDSYITPSKASHGDPSPSSVKKTQIHDSPVSRKPSVDPVATAEARKRRKELKKIKFLHARLISLHS